MLSGEMAFVPWSNSAMNDAEYKAFVQSAYDGQLLVGVNANFPPGDLRG